MGLRGVLFDLDGTLADTARAERESWEALVAVIERHVPDVERSKLHDRYHTVFEAHWTDFLKGAIDFITYRRRRLTSALEPWATVDEELFEAYRLEKRRTVERLQLFDDSVPTIRHLRAAGLRIGLLTNGPSELQRRKISVTRIEPELDAVAISEEIGVSKPDPEAFVLAAEMIGLAPTDVAMVGDSPVYDIEGAQAASCAHAVLVTRGLAIEADGATVVTALSELPAALGLPD